VRGVCRILLADDHVLFRKGIRRILEEVPEFEVVAEVGDGLELLQLLKEVLVDVVILDISMPNVRGIEVASEIVKTLPQVKVLILTMHKNKEYLYHTMSVGVRGYLLKEDPDTVLVTAIREIWQGGIYVSPLLSHHLVDGFRRGRIDHPFEPLTLREREVLQLIAEGKSSKQIAEALFISTRTVQHHRANMMRKLKFKRSTELVKYAIQKGYVGSSAGS
jgi:DNA-binding NarL/FixJ family response regulator